MSIKSAAILRRTLLALVTVAGVSVGHGAFAATTDGSATMEVNKALTITQTTALIFGTINAPSTGSNTFDLASAGTMVKTGTGDAFHAGNHAAGAWTLAGEAARTVSVTVSMGAWNDAAITTDAAYVNGATSSASVTLDGTGAGSLAIGGKVTVASTVTTGAKTATVTVTANYQ